VPQALVNKWAMHEHPVTLRLATARPAAVEDEIGGAGEHAHALQMPADEAAALEPLLARAEEAANRRLAPMLARAREPPRAAQVLDYVAAGLPATPLARDDVVCLAATHGGGLPVVETYALVRRFEWGSCRFVLHVYTALKCEEVTGLAATRPGCAPVCLYATACGCRSPSQQA